MPVGLFGLAMKIILVFGVIALSIASRSCSKFGLGVSIVRAPKRVGDQLVGDEGVLGDDHVIAGI